MKGAIIYTGKFGATRQYANWIAEDTGLPVFNLKNNRINTEEYDFFIIGSSTFVGKFTISGWIHKNWPKIKNKPLIFFSVSGTAPGHPDLQEYLEKSLPQEMIETVPYIPLRGRLILRRLPWHLRWMLKLMSKSKSLDEETRKRVKYGFDYLDREAIKPIVEFAERQKNTRKLEETVL